MDEVALVQKVLREVRGPAERWRPREEDGEAQRRAEGDNGPSGRVVEGSAHRRRTVVPHEPQLFESSVSPPHYLRLGRAVRVDGHVQVEEPLPHVEGLEAQFPEMQDRTVLVLLQRQVYPP